MGRLSSEEGLVIAGYNEANVFYIGDVDDELERTAHALTREVEEQAKLRDGHIDIWINSYGGFTHTAMHVIEAIELARRNDVIVRTIVPALALSAGSLMAVVGTPGERYIARKAEHLLHYGTIGGLAQTPEQVERSKAYQKRAFKNILDHYRDNSNVPDLESKISDDGFFVPAAQAIKWGLADKYMDKLVIGR